MPENGSPSPMIATFWSAASAEIGDRAVLEQWASRGKVLQPVYRS